MDPITNSILIFEDEDNSGKFTNYVLLQVMLLSQRYVPCVVTTIPFPFHECDLPN